MQYDTHLACAMCHVKTLRLRVAVAFTLQAWINACLHDPPVPLSSTDMMSKRLLLIKLYCFNKRLYADLDATTRLKYSNSASLCIKSCEFSTTHWRTIRPKSRLNYVTSSNSHMLLRSSSTGIGPFFSLTNKPKTGHAN